MINLKNRIIEFDKKIIVRENDILKIEIINDKSNKISSSAIHGCTIHILLNSKKFINARFEDISDATKWLSEKLNMDRTKKIIA